MMIKRSVIAILPEGVHEGDIIAQGVATVDMWSNYQSSTLIDIGMVVGEPTVREGVVRVAVKNAWGETEQQEFSTSTMLKVRRITGFSTENGRETTRTFRLNLASSSPQPDPEHQ